jgi:asparaginyl-tRNA synthetase
MLRLIRSFSTTPHRPQRLIRDILASSRVGDTVRVGGWVRTARKQKTAHFLELTDGSSAASLQVIVAQPALGQQQTTTVAVDTSNVSTGACIEVEGTLVACPPGARVAPEKAARLQSDAHTTVELAGHSIRVVGAANEYAAVVGKKHHTADVARAQWPHLLARASTAVAATTRIRSAAAGAMRQLLESADESFVWLPSPILTTNDCEGAGHAFRVLAHNDVTAAFSTTTTTTPPGNSNSNSNTALREFFSQPTFLTVSGQLHAEAYACGMSRVYTFGPTFRAEASHTRTHLAEFWMLEPEMAFGDLTSVMDLAERLVRHSIQHVLHTCQQDLLHCQARFDNNAHLIAKLEGVVAAAAFPRITYAEALQLLNNLDGLARLQWGDDLSKQHELALAEHLGGTPVFLTHFPHQHKAFYTKVSEHDARVTESVDLLLPGIGEVAGGTAREEHYDRLNERMQQLLSAEARQALAWYLELRKYGSVPHAGFGLGFERFLLFLTGAPNIRDVVPFPRTYGSCLL